MIQSFNPKEAIKYGLTEAVILEVLRTKFWLEGGPIYFTPYTLHKEVEYIKPKKVQRAILTLFFHKKIVRPPSKEGYYSLPPKPSKGF